MAKDKQKKKTTRSELRGEYKVVFKGQLMPGFDKEKVVANIAQLTKLPPEKIEKKFFSGKVVIIRRAHDEAHAQKLQQLFTRAGLEVLILKDMTKQVNQQYKSIPGKSKKAVNAKKLKKIIKRSLRPLFAIALWLVLLVMGIDLWNKYNINVEAPDEVVNIEYSLANKPLLFLAHINLDRLLSRKGYFVDDTDALPGTQTTFYKQLKKSGIDPQGSIKQILAAAYLEDKQFISQIILLGNFSVDAVKNFFIKHYHGEVLPDADFIRLRISQIDERTCAKGSFMELSIEPRRILISSDGHLSELRQLLNQEPGNVTDLNNWKEYRSDKLISLALFNPKEVNPKEVNSKKVNPGEVNSGQRAISKSGLPMMMAQSLIQENESLDSLYASVGLQLLPPAGLIDVTLNSKDQAWLNKTQSDLLKQVEEMKSDSMGLVNLQLLLSKIAFQQKTQKDLRENSDGGIGQLSMAIELDSEFRQSIESSIRELMEKFLSIGFSDELSALTSTNAQHGVQEKLDTTPLKYWPQYKPSKLKPFNEELDKFFKPAWIEGPFAVAIDELLLETHQDGDQVILQLRAKGQNIDNVGSQQATIKVTEVNDQQGNNLLDKVKCDQSTAQDEAFFSSLGGLRTAYLGDKQVNYNELEVRQKVKLKKGIKFSQVKSLTGEIELNLATQTQIKEFVKTDQNRIVSEYGTRILFKPSAVDSLSYTVSGNDKNLLLVRALNKKKEYLSRMSRSSMENLFASGYSETQQYQGEIAFVEVVYATQFEKITYPFVISKFPPYPSEKQWKYELEFTKLSSIANWNKSYQDLAPLDLTEENNWHGEIQASWHNGPMNLALYGLKTSKHWGTTGQLTIKTPLIDELRHNLSALEVYIRYPQASETGAMGHSYYYPLKAKGYYMNGEFIPNKDKPYMDGQLSFTLPYNNEKTPLTEIHGDIIVHIPVSKHSSSYSDMSIGAQWEDEGVRTKIVRLGNEIMEFEVSGNRERLLQITLLDSNNQRISTADIRQSQMQNKGGNIILNYHGIPVKAMLTVSEGQQTKRYPFNLKLK